jgi:pentatricopeptide repeat protein
VAVEEKELSMSVVGFNAALSSCAQAGDWERAIYLLERMKAAAPKTSTALEARIPAPDAVTYGTVLAACERGEQWSLILKYAKSMEVQLGLDFLDGLSITSCLHACQQLGLAEEALYYLDVMKRLECPQRKTSGWKRQGVRQPLQGPDPVAYHLAISACARGGAWQDGLRLLNEHEKVTGAAPDVVAYTSAITGCEYAGEWKQAFLLLDKMRQQGVEANEMTMTAVLSACATALAKKNRVRNGEEAEKVVGGTVAEAMPEEQIRALQLLSVLKKDPNTVKPNIQIYNAAIRVCAEAFDLDRAMKLLEQIQKEGLQRTVVTYGSLMTACERVGCVDSASKVFRSMKADNITRNEKVYGAAISCCRKAKEPERALLLLRKMIQEGLTPNAATFNTVMMAQTEGRAKIDMERAVLVFKLMQSKFAAEKSRPNRQTYSMLVLLFATSMQPNTAERFLRKMRDDGFVPDVDLFTATVTGYERTGQPLKALRLMESMQADGYDFYGVKVLNTAFKKAVQLANLVGRNLASPDDEEKEDPSFQLDNIDEDGEAFLQVNR